MASGSARLSKNTRNGNAKFLIEIEVGRTGICASGVNRIEPSTISGEGTSQNERHAWAGDWGLHQTPIFLLPGSAIEFQDIRIWPLTIANG